MLRNREIRRFTACFAGMTLVVAAAGFAIGPSSGILALCAAAAYGAAFLIFTRARYKSIAKISEQVDLVLHSEDLLYISEVDEGELSILQTEIAKMTVRIREQNDALKKDREFLADSLADIAHQLRTPLTSANLILSLLKGDASREQRKVWLREMEELFAQMDWLVTSLLKLSRLDAKLVVFRKEQIPVDGLLRAAARPLLIPMELHDITLTADVPEDLKIWGDPEWLAEALRNVLKNCMESAGDGGSIEVVCEDNLLYAQITIRDSGPGFAREDLPHIFDRFYRGRAGNARGNAEEVGQDNTACTGYGRDDSQGEGEGGSSAESGGDAKGRGSAGGYGIGLALCRTIISRQGGTITARNHPRGGAMFLIRFPK